MPQELTLQTLQDLLSGDAVAIRRVQQLLPAGGPGDKVFPPTYEGSQYAAENRILDGREVPCVLLDSVQSQANRMEQALRETFYRGQDQEADIPIVLVDFVSAGLPEVGELTSLDVPHRLADAILRDSEYEGQPFPQSPIGRALTEASTSNATGLFQFSPTSLVFGVWDSTGKSGGLGTKFQRVLVGEVIAFFATKGVRPTSRIDPLGIELDAATIYEAADGSGWTLDANLAAKDGKGNLKTIKPSETNHGNVTPTLVNHKTKQPNHGGITFEFAKQMIVISLPAIRRLHFPVGGREDQRRNAAAWTALTALGIAAADLSIRKGCDLRSRCLLVPDSSRPVAWECIRGDGSVESFSIGDSTRLLREAASAAEALGLPSWRRKPWVLRPSGKLVELVRRNRKSGPVVED